MVLPGLTSIGTASEHRTRMLSLCLRASAAIHPATCTQNAAQREEGPVLYPAGWTQEKIL